MKNKSRVFFWSLFDFANSSYASIIVAFVFAVYFTETICSGLPVGDLYWSLGINISMIISAVLNPFFGTLADYLSNKKLFLFLFTVLCVFATALLYFTGEGTVLFALFLFILSNIGFQTGLTFYDAFISDMVEETYYNKVSGIGYAVGYVGSLFSILLVLPFRDNYNLLFVVSSLIFAVFSLPLFLFVKEKRNLHPQRLRNINYFSYGFRKVFDTVKNINRYRNLKYFLIAFFLYIDAVNTIIFFAGIYAKKSLGFSMTGLVIFFIIVQITALAGSLILSSVADKIGILKSIFLTLFCWSAIILVIFLFVSDSSYIVLKNTFLNDLLKIDLIQIHYFFIVGGFAGVFLGSTQSLSRALMTKLAPFEIKTQLFGFYALFDKTATLLGPLTFGLVSWLSGSQRFAVLSVLIFFISGMIVLKKVKFSS